MSMHQSLEVFKVLKWYYFGETSVYLLPHVEVKIILVRTVSSFPNIKLDHYLYTKSNHNHK